MSAPLRWSMSPGLVLSLWRGSARTMPMGAFEVTEQELVDLLRKRGWRVTK